MEEIIISLEPVFHRAERFLLWHNRYVSLVAFVLLHGVFYAVARAGLRPFCAIVLVLFAFHLLDFFKKRATTTAANDEKNLSALTQFVLQSYRYLWQTHDQFNSIKARNQTKYSIMVMLICLLSAYVGVKINGFYVSYLIMFVLFTLPAVVHHKLAHKVLKRLAPILEQLDQSMEFKRRTLIDRKDLLVKIKSPGLNDDDSDEKDVRTVAVASAPVDSQELSDTMKPSDSSFDMLSDSSSSNADDETARMNELYANIGDRIDGKHRIKIKGDEVKIKGYSNRQRPKIMDATFFQSYASQPAAEPDLTSFDFLNDYEEKS